MKKTKCLQIKVTGKVQGVWFRGNTREKANELDIKGIVKNLPDGSVYIEAEGDKVTMQKFVAWCHEGSPQARVDDIEIIEIAPKEFQDFKIVRAPFL